jgi:general secretion pathway protein A
MTFGLRKNPFSMTPDPSFLFMTEQHREGLAGLTYAILERKGFAVLTGEVGTGKTTLLARVLQFVPSTRLQFSLIVNPTLTPSEFLEMTLLDFGVKDIPSSKAQRLWKLQSLLLQGQREGKVSALIVDEAHKLSPDVLEEIRLLGNFEEADQKLLQILLVGQTELDDILNREDLRQLKQRVAVRLSIGPLAQTEVSQYIRHRWLRAGGTEPPFSTNAMSDIADASHGVPRLINSVCENALTLAFAEGSSLVERRHVQAAMADLRLCPPPISRVAGEPSKPAPTEPPSEPMSTWARWLGKLGRGTTTWSKMRTRSRRGRPVARVVAARLAGAVAGVRRLVGRECKPSLE